MSKRNQAIEIMKQNSSLDMNAIVPLIAKAIDVSEANARSYYRYIVQNGLATGNVVTKVRAKKVKTKAVPAEKLLKELNLKPSARPNEAAEALKDIEAIKAKNFETMRKVSGNYSKKLIESMGDGVDLSELEDRETVKSIVPRFLHKEMGLA